MRRLIALAFLLLATRALADVSVTATVDQRRIAFGESLTLTITVQGAQNAQPQVTPVDGLSFAGPAVQTAVQFVNGARSQSVTYSYQVTPTRIGQFTIPAYKVDAGGKQYQTAPIEVTVEKGAAPATAESQLFGKIEVGAQQIYLGQTVPLNVYVFARQNLPMRGLANPQFEADGLGYKFLNNVATGQQAINGESFTVYRITGALAPTKTGKLTFGPYVIRAQLTAERRRPGNIFDEMMGRVEVREVPVTIDAVPVEVLPLPTEGRPADFNGAVGPWKMEVTAKPTEIAIGDPVTFTIKLTGSGVIVPDVSLTGADGFRTHAPITKTTPNELNTEVVRDIEQVLFARSADVKALPGVRMSYFDPVARAYKTQEQPPIPLVVNAGNGHTAIVSSSGSIRRDEKLGQDIVYLKGHLGTVPAVLTPTGFWLLNLAPLLALTGAVVWKRRVDRLRGDIAYARRSRAAKTARKQLAAATDFDGVQRALQSYLGDRLNIPATGITASIADEHNLPAVVREIFELCDAARFAGAATDLAALKQSVEGVIDELETKSS